jgi:hypothetical protein
LGCCGRAFPRGLTPWHELGSAWATIRSNECSYRFRLSDRAGRRTGSKSKNAACAAVIRHAPKVAMFGDSGQ